MTAWVFGWAVICGQGGQKRAQHIAMGEPVLRVMEEEMLWIFIACGLFDRKSMTQVQRRSSAKVCEVYEPVCSMIVLLMWSVQRAYGHMSPYSPGEGSMNHREDDILVGGCLDEIGVEDVHRHRCLTTCWPGQHCTQYPSAGSSLLWCHAEGIFTGW